MPGAANLLGCETDPAGPALDFLLIFQYLILYLTSFYPPVKFSPPQIWFFSPRLYILISETCFTTTIPQPHNHQKLEKTTMTIRLPPDNFLDRILAIFGKKRKTIMPENINQIENQLGPYVTIKARKEGFFKALFRHQQ